MPEMPQAAPLPDRPPLHLKGEYLAIASPDSISEASFSIPAVRAIREVRPNSTIVVAANQETAPLWHKVDAVNQVVEHSPSDSARKIAKLLKDADIPFDSSIAWEGSAAAQAFAKIGIKDRLGYPTEKLAKSLTDPVKVERIGGPIEHRVQHYLLFVEKLGAKPFQAVHFKTPPRPTVTGRTILAISPGSDFGSAAEWPLDRFQELASAFSGQFELAIIPHPDRPGPASALAKSLGKEITSLEGIELIEFLASCHGLIGSDGSIPHLAAFVGTPSLVFFGPNEPEWRRPLGTIHRIIREHVPCSGCLLNKCPLDHRCMNEITVKHALSEARSLFGVAAS